MYLHLGQSKMISHREIIGIFDLDNASWAFKTREFLNRAEKEGRTEWLSGDLPRSFVVAEEPNCEKKVYICSLSSPALRSRAERDGMEMK